MCGPPGKRQFVVSPVSAALVGPVWGLQVIPFARKRTPPRAPVAAYLLAIAALLGANAAVLSALGRPLLCPCGFAKFWQGDIRGAESSQHFSDWYSASHVIFGALVFWVMWKTSRHWPRGWLVVAAAAASVGWEIAENLTFMIERFGRTGLGQPYTGDSILNSLADSLFALAGFGLAMRLPAAATLAIMAGLEIAAALTVRDSFVLTLVTFIHPIETVQRWQAGG